MLSRFGIEASQAAQYVIAFVIILVLVALFGVVLRRLTGGRLMLPGQDRGRARQPRLGIVDIYDLDRQRQLILLRRDNVEHLLLIGGPNDVVIETNIVRVPGARLPASATDTVVERTEPAFERPPEPARPQIEPSNGRPSIEAQLAARLGALASRPPESAPSGSSDAEEELAPIMTASAPASVRPEPALKPDAVTLAPQAAMPVPPRPAPPMPVPQTPPRPGPVEPPPFLRPEPRPEPRPAPVAAAPMQPPRPAPVPAPAPAPASPPSPPPAPVPSAGPAPVFQPPRPAPAAPPSPPAPAEQRAPDAALLSDMAKQLEEALRRPNVGPARPAPAPTPPAPPAAPSAGALPVPPAAPPSGAIPAPPIPPGAVVSSAPNVATDPQRDEEDDEADDLLEPSEEPRPASGPTPPATRAPEPPRPNPEPPRPAAEAPRPAPEPPRFVPPAAAPLPNGPAVPAPTRTPEPATPPAAAASPASPRVVDDPFSVEEIEAEFARLLGRPGGDKS